MNGFACIPHDWSRDPRLSLKAKGLLVYLFSHASGYELTIDQIVAENADGPRAVRTAMGQLISLGYVERTRHRGQDGTLGVYRYTVVSVVATTVSIAAARPLDAETHAGSDQARCNVSAGRPPDAETHAGPEQPLPDVSAGRNQMPLSTVDNGIWAPPGAETQPDADLQEQTVSAGRNQSALSTVENGTSKEEQPKNIKKIKKTYADPLGRLDTDPDFVAFWDAYPRRTDKGHARKAWAKAIERGVDPQLIIGGAKAFRNNPRRSPDPQFVPHPATWLNGERWLDEDHVVAPKQNFDAWWNN